jgi:DNA-binding transcriptional LysR family regulator
VRVTALGAQVMDHARSIRAHAVRLQRDVAALRKEPAVHLHFAAAPVVPVSAAALAILDVLAEMPAVHIHFTVGQPSDMIQLLRKGDVEMAMVPLGGSEQQAFDCELLYYDAMAIYGRAGHPLTTARRVDIAQLGQQPWVLGPGGSLVRTRIEELFAGHGAAPPRIALEVDDVSLRRSLVMHSDHLSAFQVHHVYNELRTGLIAQVPHRWSQDISAVGLLRLLPYTDLSRSLRQAFIRRFEEAGMQMARDIGAPVAVAPRSHPKPPAVRPGRGGRLSAHASGRRKG